jgi:SAM-dependent methyltransferase
LVFKALLRGEHTIDDSKIRDFYERMPYPAPLASLDEHKALYRDPLRHRAQFHRIWPNERSGQRQKVLVAGCGTSQAARYALREPNARVTAIDISETSLRHTYVLQKKYALDNLELRQLAVEDSADLHCSFDLIVCTGVLHHLPDPEAGLRALRSVLNPKGAMNLMVYGTYGRTGIYMLQEYCRMLRIGTSANDLRDLSSLLAAMPKDHPLAAILERAEELRQPAALADALLHPRDRAYTVPELYAWLGRCGVAFGRWLEQAPYLPQCGAMAQLNREARFDALTDPEKHAAAELFRGTMAQHRLIVYRSDYPGGVPAVSFSGTAWRDYIPIRLPWTITVRERLPTGSVAVLINRAHTHNDLILPINAAQDRLVSLIDGERTLGDILGRNRSVEDLSRSVEFFQQLWAYDQVVFDASRAG